MTKELQIEQISLEGLNFTFVTNDESELLRANIIFPFDPNFLMQNNIPYETPHVFEHVVCCGDGTVPAAVFKEELNVFGGYTNAFTSSTVNGQVSFETTQPDDGVGLVVKNVQSAFQPGLAEADLAEQVVIVKNELQGYLHDPRRQRSIQKEYEQGSMYRTEPMGLSTLNAISIDHLQQFYRTIVTKENARIILTGREDVVQNAAVKIATLIKNTVEGTRKVFAKKSDLRSIPDYHAAAAEIPVGMTDYFYGNVVEGNLGSGLTISEFKIIMDAFYEHFNDGEQGIIEQSRKRGISYGVSIGQRYNRRQTSLSISDTTALAHVNPEIDLFTESLQRFAEYSVGDFERFRLKFIGHNKMYPVDLVSFAKNVEATVACEEEPLFMIPQQVRASARDIAAETVVTRIKDIAARLLNPDFIVRSSFGENPFIQAIK